MFGMYICILCNYRIVQEIQYLFHHF